MPAAYPRFTQWELTRTQLAALYAIQETLDLDLACKQLKITKHTLNQLFIFIRESMGLHSTLACIIVFDRWSDSSREEWAELKQKLAL